VVIGYPFFSLQGFVIILFLVETLPTGYGFQTPLRIADCGSRVSKSDYCEQLALNSERSMVFLFDLSQGRAVLLLLVGLSSPKGRLVDGFLRKHGGEAGERLVIVQRLFRIEWSTWAPEVGWHQKRCFTKGEASYWRRIEGAL
jgi:hypothetical protein